MVNLASMADLSNYNGPVNITGTSNNGGDYINKVSINGALNVTAFPGSDIGLQTNAANAALPIDTNTTNGFHRGTLYIPALPGGGGTYNFVNTIKLDPYVRLVCDPAVVLNYTGPANTDAINQQDPVAENTPSVYGGVENCQIHLNSTGQVGIHVGDISGQRYDHNVIWSATYPGLAGTIGIKVTNRVYFTEHSHYEGNILQNVNEGFDFDLACAPNNTTFTGSISGTTLTAAAGSTGIYTGATLAGTGVTSNTGLIKFLTGTGGPGTYQVYPSQNVASTTITQTNICAAAADNMYNFITGNYCQIGIPGGNCLEATGGMQMLQNWTGLNANINGAGGAVIYTDANSRYYNNIDAINAESTAGGGFCTNTAHALTDPLGLTLNGSVVCAMSSATAGVASPTTALVTGVLYSHYGTAGTYSIFFGSGLVDLMLWGAGGGGYNGATGGYGGGSGGYIHCIVNGPANSVGTLVVGAGGAGGNPGATGGDTSFTYGSSSCIAHGGTGGSLSAAGTGGTTVANAGAPLFQMTGPNSSGAYGGNGTPGYCPCGGNAVGLGGTGKGSDGMIWFMAR